MFKKKVVSISSAKGELWKKLWAIDWPFEMLYEDSGWNEYLGYWTIAGWNWTSINKGWTIKGLQNGQSYSKLGYCSICCMRSTLFAHDYWVPFPYFIKILTTFCRYEDCFDIYSFFCELKMKFRIRINTYKSNYSAYTYILIFILILFAGYVWWERQWGEAHHVQREYIQHADGRLALYAVSTKFLRSKSGSLL